MTEPGQFGFDLSAAQEQRASRLHKESIIFDTLCQHAGPTIYEDFPKDIVDEFYEKLGEQPKGMPAFIWATYWAYEMSKQGRSDLLPQYLRDSGLTCGTYLLGVHDDDPLWTKWEELTNRYRDLPWLKYITTAEEIRQAKREGLIAFYAHNQPVSPPTRDLKLFDIAYQKGLRSFMLTYNRMDNIGVGCTERVDAGLSMFGVDVVHHLNEIGMMVDVSHCGYQTTMDACRVSKRPVNANHTSARSVYNHPRSKSDDQLRAIADTGGIIGVYTVPTFITADPNPTIEHVLDHIDYIADLVGWQHVALGTDWPLSMPNDVLLSTFGTDAQLGFRPAARGRPIDLDLTQTVEGFLDLRDLPNITRGLVKRGCSDEQIQGILGENALRIFEEICG